MLMAFKIIIHMYIRLKIAFVCLVILFTNSCKKENLDSPKLNLIIDADTANEVDDLFAIVRAINEPKFNLLGITSAQFHTSPYASDSTVYESQNINKTILRLMHRDNLPLPLGSNSPLATTNTPSSSEASKFIIKSAHALPNNQKLHITILGPCTNVASAILEDPTITPKLSVHYIGFWHTAATNTVNRNEFNSRNDQNAVDVLLNTVGLDFNVMTATTSKHLVFKKSDVDLHLKNKSEIGNYLANRWETYTRWWTKKDPEKNEWIMWDVAIIEALANPKLSVKQQFLTPKTNTQRYIGMHTAINAEQMTTNFWNVVKQ